MQGIESSSKNQVDQQNYWLRLIRDQRWSATQKRRLLNQFGSPAALYALSPQQMSTLPCKPADRKAEPIVSDQPDADLQWLQQSNRHLITQQDPRYPDLLGELEDPPLALFAEGNLDLLDQPKIAIVGSRRPTPAGVKLTQQLAAGLAELGIVITSGMALGIDGIAHCAVLDGGHPTIAIMGCGLDQVYPPRHRRLYGRIAEAGLLLSEYPIGYPPTRYSFPQRNRIVSGLCYGSIIMEAAERSGTTITARLTMEQNREVMVVPGSPLNPQYAGSNRLIQQGAALITSVEDVLQVVSIPLQSALHGIAHSEPASPNDAPQTELLEHIGFDSTSVDQIILASGLTAAKVSSMLLLLELEGAVAANGEGGYVRLR